MRQLVIAQRVCLTGHILAKAFGLIGILLVIPNAETIFNSGEVGQKAMQLSMADGGVVDIILGTIAVSIYAYRVLGWRTWLGFLLPSVLISVGSELLGTSTGFPFGYYSYLSGLGYKIAGLVPFTIPLSWFYVGLSAYLIARTGLRVAQNPSLVGQVGAIALGALLFTCWDFALEPAMSQTSLPFWFWENPGEFFGTPYQNYAGWFGTSALFMSVAALLWRNTPIKLERSQLNVPLVVYLSNFAFAAGLSLAAGFAIPVSLGFVLGVVPAVVLWWRSIAASANVAVAPTTEVTVASVKVAVK
ncbi:carotenoid biosynthesis protein [Brasilonema octagenarum UFV-E1]|uniref:Carotenoid biosynthesis protein n=2 Tax=Brasilonema TaxID=383614 RepID=A0A856MFA9_9CYAN|nr:MULTISPECIES: carotenoid biosynthesis protein [Brasilonema]NMF65668.1 carotenoid biosynthesis protein [Brasilonema octagenarum UFV-OR1]QDL08839.1 carotenoid biosynthesis protein [Brasilonema sennae CENA114]QDL15196.1 carotenoid biosynthesis protein [Brasilonema octagenarum UFV-E1]